MKTSAVSSPKLSSNRRTFLKSAGVLALGAPAVMADTPAAMPESAQWWNGAGRLQLLAEGMIPFIQVTPPIPWVLPPLLQPLGLPPDTVVWLKAAFPMPDTKDVLAVQIVAVSQFLPGPLKLSQLEAKISAVELTYKPGLNLALLGRVLANNPALLGDMTGAAFVLTTGAVLHEDASADFQLLAVHVPGHHTTMAEAGLGTLIIR